MKRIVVAILILVCSSKVFSQGMDASSIMNNMSSDQLQQLKNMAGSSNILNGNNSIMGGGLNGSSSSKPSMDRTQITGTDADSFKLSQQQQMMNQQNADNQLNTIIDYIKKYDSIKNIKVPKSKIFGQDYFTSNTISIFDKSQNGKAPDNYILDDGDELNISLWGYSEYNEVFKIDADGYIQPQNIGRIYLKGLSFKDGKDVITKKFAGVYDLKNSKIAIRLNYSRIISVHIVGQVNNPGTYSLPALNSAFNALIAAKGVDSLGTVRTIKIKRDGKIIKTLDLYNFLINSANNEDYYLRDNDYIIVSSYNQRVVVTGEVKRPMTYEMVDNESLIDLIKFAGGLKASAYTKNIRVKHYLNNKMMLVDVNFDELVANKAAFKLSDGDEVFVSKIDTEIVNKVTLKGAVRVPNDYEITEITKVADVIKRSGGILYSSYIPKAYIVRTSKIDLKKSYLKFNVDSVLNFPNIKTNYLLKPLDIIEVFSKHRFEDSIKIKINGAVRIPGLYTFGAGFTLKDALYYAGGLKPEAAGNRIEISRIINLDELSKKDTPSKTAIKTIQINTDLTIDETSENFELQPYDEVFVRQIPEFEYQQDVYLSGEIKYPGTYSLISKNEKLMDVIKRAGGMLPTAFHKGITLIRGEKKLGLVVVDIDKAIRRPNSQFNYLLRKGDSIRFDKINELVSVMGEVQFNGIDSTKQINVPYFAGKRAGFYIKNFVGGFNTNAFRRKTIVVDANGRIRSTRKLLGVYNYYPRVNMGSKIIVPKKIDTSLKPDGTPIDWNRVIENATVKVTAILTIIILAQRIK
ncbi:MAG: hypothetical protein RJA07_2532 [Bacteroidota bacterium]|jgi:protein involved in polysaccharide export with SLBB domain